MRATVRSATVDDLEAVADLWSIAAGPNRLASGVAEAARLHDRDPHALIVAERDGQVIGTLIVGWDGWRCHLYRMAVHDSARRFGVATALVSEAMRRATLLGAPRVDAMVADANASGIQFWQSVGFTLDTEDRRWSLLMEYLAG